jgi:hypothetical protein
MAEGNEDYERLLDIGSFGLAESWGVQMIHHKMGAGRRRSILVGSRAGERKWRFVYKLLPDTMDGAIQTTDVLIESRAMYIYRLFIRSKVGHEDVNRPIYVTSPIDGKDYLAVFVDDEISFEMFATKLFSSQLQLEQARVPGLNVGGNDFGTSENPERI